MHLALSTGSLRSWHDDDAPALAEHANNINVWRTLRDHMPHPYTLAHAEEYLRKVQHQQPELSLCIDVDGRAVGGISLHPSEDVHRLTAELGYWLAEPFWGRGIATAAVNAIVGHGFALLPLVRIEAHVFANNPASARVLEKAGFTFEGRLARNVIKEGRILDSLVYSRLRDDEVARDPHAANLLGWTQPLRTA